MRVICIEVPAKAHNNAGIVEGQILEVVETLYDHDGAWYHFTIDHEYGYKAKYFIPLSSIDETEFERNYKKEPAWIEAFNKL